MDLLLNRTQTGASGVFGNLTAGDAEQVASTLEHSYLTGETWAPKIPPGEYTCIRSLHRLHGMDHDFETFEITGVAGHSGLLFHWGNFNKDSDGCILLGRNRVGDTVTDSRNAFEAFMGRFAGVDSFQLLVQG